MKRSTKGIKSVKSRMYTIWLVYTFISTLAEESKADSVLYICYEHRPKQVLTFKKENKSEYYLLDIEVASLRGPLLNLLMEGVHIWYSDCKYM